MSAFTFRMAIGAPTHLPLTRQEVSERIEALIALFDALDGDPDFEAGGDEEASLGWVSALNHGADRFPGEDLEEDAGDEGEPDVDGEPTLGWTLAGANGSQSSYLHQEDEESDNGIADGGALDLLMQDKLAERLLVEGRDAL